MSSQAFAGAATPPVGKRAAARKSRWSCCGEQHDGSVVALMVAAAQPAAGYCAPHSPRQP